MPARGRRRLRGTDLDLVLAGVAYVAAVASLIAYLLVSGGHGRPSRLQFALLVVPVAVLYGLSIRLSGS